MPIAKTAEIGHGGKSKAIVIGREIALRGEGSEVV
jgi:muramoyltetrapeptide carboxypeptidase LdcA involved in peptidoglycan recycling